MERMAMRHLFILPCVHLRYSGHFDMSAFGYFVTLAYLHFDLLAFVNLGIVTFWHFWIWISQSR